MQKAFPTSDESCKRKCNTTKKTKKSLFWHHNKNLTQFPGNMLPERTHVFHSAWKIKELQHKTNISGLRILRVRWPNGRNFSRVHGDCHILLRIQVRVVLEWETYLIINANVWTKQKLMLYLIICSLFWELALERGSNPVPPAVLADLLPVALCRPHLMFQILRPSGARRLR